MTILTGSKYNPARGGHAPGDVRDAFVEAVDAYEAWKDGTPEPTVELREQQVPITQVFGLLWNCSDVLPRSMVTQISDLTDESLHRTTYGAAARLLRGWVLRHTTQAA